MRGEGAIRIVRLRRGSGHRSVQAVHQPPDVRPSLTYDADLIRVQCNYGMFMYVTHRRTATCTSTLHCFIITFALTLHAIMCTFDTPVLLPGCAHPE